VPSHPAPAGGKFVVGWKIKAGNSGGPVLVENLQLACRSL
jgi:hypothetical protein